MSEHANPLAVQRTAQDVINAYAKQLMEERSAPRPDTERVEWLKAELAVCGADLQALDDADPDEVDEIAARYAARAQALGQ
ncbi:hypothetical protein [Streptomyces xanthochromogenes]|uniref:hypothetical protein n=1 Tax=Streptomyces xanthochromogenes TaxID=67384 RepID=UPI001422837F